MIEKPKVTVTLAIDVEKWMAGRCKFNYNPKTGNWHGKDAFCDYVFPFASQSWCSIEKVMN